MKRLFKKLANTNISTAYIFILLGISTLMMAGYFSYAWFTVQGVQKNQMWAFSNEKTEQTGALTDYRYIGANPNNYVKFNDELWRIIGVFEVDDGTGKIEKRMKIIRNESIGYYAWDNKDTASGAETNYGKNNWPDARLNYLLNEGHEYNSAGGSLYWNREKGICYFSSNNGMIDCDFTSTGLTEEARKMMGDAKWYLGGFGESPSYLWVVTSEWYNYERELKFIVDMI